MELNKTKNAFLILSSKFYNHFEEALILANTAGYEIVGTKRFRGGKRITDGLIEIVKNNKKELDFDTVIYYGDIEPSSVFKLEKETKIRVLDRVQLILEIFALHAGSKEALLQIEMARIRHDLPIIREYIRRTKLGELPGFLGPGRYGIDTYKKQLTSRLSKIKRDLEDLRITEQERLKRRKELGMINIPIVGYASAGKTSLFNIITGESKPVGPEYFTTLFPKHKTINYNGLKLAFVDTVGFIRDVPPEVIEAFYSTLEEVTISDIIVFVIDITENENDIKEKILAGTDILKKLNALNKPIIFALNKIDEIDKIKIYDKIEFVKKTFPNDKMVLISAKKNIGIDALLNEIINITKNLNIY
ncbi:GTP-binding protein HflX [Caldisphaera lagunensis DSM 15908]|uniref:GTP-binding protein HflX n=1 Tax=Caldisphaera lagunensis (strain DSM 15908 / JCM 11604 / ANMR 0165 / IC-154) TaxID=1056495 RepID=L0AC38_CALLD|nr:GTPase HflX [Caldisphaera lagunensis]AFZ70999.1 GTP-binding protein HflX [Caldisphaera lagunensis DSM 15908]